MTNTKPLSSDFTILLKFILPGIFISGILFAIVSLIMEGQYIGALAAIFVLFLVGGLLTLISKSIYKVELDERYFHISNYFKTIKVPITDLESSYDIRVFYPRPIFLNFKPETDFGAQIIFLGYSDLLTTFSKHPTAEEIEKLLKTRR